MSANYLCENVVVDGWEEIPEVDVQSLSAVAVCSKRRKRYLLGVDVFQLRC